MKNTLKLIMAGVLAVSAPGLVSCGQENTTPESGDTTGHTEMVYETLAGTEWEGSFATHGQESGYTNIPVTIHWTVDFLQNGRGEVMFWFESELFDNTPYTLDMTYTYDGNNAGVLLEQDDSSPFTIDPYNRTMSVSLTVNLQHTEDGPVFTYGGRTTLHQTR